MGAPVSITYQRAKPTCIVIGMSVGYQIVGGYVKVRESLYIQVISWFNTIFNLIDTAIFSSSKFEDISW